LTPLHAYYYVLCRAVQAFAVLLLGLSGIMLLAMLLSFAPTAAWSYPWWSPVVVALLIGFGLLLLKAMRLVIQRMRATD